MNYTKTSINTQAINNKIGTITQNYFSEGTKKRVISGVPLTSYKEVVDKLNNHQDFKPKYYGLNLYEFNEVQIKLDRQKLFLANNYLYDKISRKYITLEQCATSANHNPNRYYAQIQNRINTLT